MNSTLSSLRRSCAEQLLDLYFRANAGHIGSSLSCLEILLDLLGHRMRESDRLVLSKGHAAAALYVSLAATGRLDPKELDTFYRDGTRLAAHPPCSGEISGIPFGAGSLGHGLSLAAGMAFAQKFTGKGKRFYAVLSDGECDEGSTWEAALFAAHHRLTNLTVIVDRNGIQGIGKTETVMSLEPFADKWRSFGFDVAEASNGNSFEELAAAHEKFPATSDRPRCIVAHTTKGHGVSYMAGTVDWHYLPMNAELYAKAKAELGAGNA